jgi:hypothetical protein
MGENEIANDLTGREYAGMGVPSRNIRQKSRVLID